MTDIQRPESIGQAHRIMIQMQARIKSLRGENESISETCDAYITEATELQDRIDELENELRLERLPKHVPERCDDNRGEG